MTGIDEIIPDKLYLSGKPGASNYKLLKTNKIYSIVNMSESENLFDFSFVYLKLDIQDHPTQDIKKHFKRVFRFINKSRGRVLVHCLGGISRSVSFVIAYLMENEKKCLRDSVMHVSKCRIYAQPNEGFMNQLIAFEEELIKNGILPAETEKYTMEQYKCFCVQKYLGKKVNVSDDNVIHILRAKNQSVSETCRVLMMKK